MVLRDQGALVIMATRAEECAVPSHLSALSDEEAIALGVAPSVLSGFRTRWGISSDEQFKFRFYLRVVPNVMAAFATYDTVAVFEGMRRIDQSFAVGTFHDDI
jgi:hypothetical protein